MADLVNAADLAVRGELDRPGDDGDADGSASPPPLARIRRPGEADHTGAVREQGHRQAGGGIARPTGWRDLGSQSAWPPPEKAFSEPETAPRLPLNEKRSAVLHSKQASKLEPPYGIEP